LFGAVGPQRGVSPFAGQPARKEMLVDLARLEREYFDRRPDPDDPACKVRVGAGGHRGSPFRGTFTEAHVLAFIQAVCDCRRIQGTDGPLYIGRDTHALSGPAQRTALEVLAANRVHSVIQQGDGVTPAPVISHAILEHNHGRLRHLADGLVVSPSCGPPEDGGLKYSSPAGGAADPELRRQIEARANELLRSGNAEVRRLPLPTALHAPTTHREDLLLPYVHELRNVVDMDIVRHHGLRLAADPLGGAAVSYWEPIASIYRLDITVVNETIDPAFGFLPLDQDGKLRIDCSSPYATARLIALKDRYQVSFANDPAADRFGIVTPSAGLLTTRQYLAVAAHYLLRHRPGWPPHAAIGKTVVGSALMDRVGIKVARRIYEVPVGFHWFAPGLYDGEICFCGEDSGGTGFLRHDGTVWTTERDGIVANLLAAEITAVTDRDPGQHYRELTAELGTPQYIGIEVPATPAEKAKIAALSTDGVRDSMLASEAITARLDRAPYNGAPLGGLKVTAANGWFAVVPSGTENCYRIHAESFRGQQHLEAIVAEARQIVNRAVGGQGRRS